MNFGSTFAAIAGYLLFLFAMVAGFSTLPGLGFMIGGWTMFLIAAIHEVGQRIVEAMPRK